MEITTRHSAPSWRETADQGIARIENLKPTVSPWSPNRPSATALERAKSLIGAISRDDLPLPLISTSLEGTLCLQWRERDQRLYFFVHQNGEIEFYGRRRTASRPSSLDGVIQLHKGLERVNEIVRFVFR